MARNYILDKETVARKLQRIAYEIIENNLDENNIILEVKTVSDLHQRHQEHTINYLCVSGLRLGLLVNFRSDSLKYKRLVY